jgi:hypothetical protein
MLLLFSHLYICFIGAYLDICHTVRMQTVNSPVIRVQADVCGALPAVCIVLYQFPSKIVSVRTALVAFERFSVISNMQIMELSKSRTASMSGFHPILVDAVDE